MVHIYYGDGKGKTTAAFGLAVRALGAGLRVLAVQFFKTQETGEVSFLDNVENATVMRPEAGGGFTVTMDEQDFLQTKEEHDRMLAYAAEGANSGRYDLIVLDEALDAYEWELMSKSVLQALLCDAPEGVEIVLTGRKPCGLEEYADYITELKKVKHPYDAGQLARRGIEY
jgi:cob(I)alamin adenosyltransferase